MEDRSGHGLLGHVILCCKSRLLGFSIPLAVFASRLLLLFVLVKAVVVKRIVLDYGSLYIVLLHVFVSLETRNLAHILPLGA